MNSLNSEELQTYIDAFDTIHAKELEYFPEFQVMNRPSKIEAFQEEFASSMYESIGDSDDQSENTND